MRALCLKKDKGVVLQNIPQPESAEPAHLHIKMTACGINLGDNAFIGGAFAKGTIPESLYDICGVSGVGRVMQAGAGVSAGYLGRHVAIYRSLKFSDKILGTWCEEAHLHQQHCVLLPEDIDPEAYAGSLVNCITPFAFLKQIIEEGHKGIIATAGTSATGIAMVGICEAYNFPLISIVRSEAGKQQLELLGAKNIVVQTGGDFKQQLEKLSENLNATAVFDGVGGALLNGIWEAFPRHTTIYSYGYLGGLAPLTIHPGLLMRKNLTIRSFGNFTSKTVQDAGQLNHALAELAKIIHQPHFKTRIGRKFKFGEIREALEYSSPGGGKAILYP